MFSGARNPTVLLEILSDVIGSQKFMMAASNLEIRISRLVDMIATKFQRLTPMFLGARYTTVILGILYDNNKWYNRDTLWFMTYAKPIDNWQLRLIWWAIASRIASGLANWNIHTSQSEVLELSHSPSLNNGFSSISLGSRVNLFFHAKYENSATTPPTMTAGTQHLPNHDNCTIANDVTHTVQSYLH